MMMAETTTLTAEQQKEFVRLVGALSPENLYCDGEISHAQGVKKYKALRKQWWALEIRVGRKVTEDEVWAAHMAENRKE
jgi:hypothetical protein